MVLLINRNKKKVDKFHLLKKGKFSGVARGGDTSMAGMAIAIPGVLDILETGDTMGKIRLHGGKKR